MKRLLKYVLLALLLAILTLVIFVFYKQSKAARTLIPLQTNVLIKVDMVRVLRNLLTDNVRSLSLSTSDKKALKGFEMPAYLYFYTLQNQSDNRLFTSLTLNNVHDFEQSLNQFGTWKKTASTNGIIFLSQQYVLIACNSSKASILIGKHSNADSTILKQMLTEAEQIAVSKSSFAGINKESGTIVAMLPQGKVNINFKKGKIVANALLDWDSNTIPEMVHTSLSEREQPFIFWYFGSFNKWLQHQTFNVDTITIHGDSLMYYAPKAIICSVSDSSLHQLDTVVTYLYNDDFEKIPTTITNNVKVPKMYLEAIFDQSSMSYFNRQGIISNQSLNRVIFPMYKVNVQQKGTSLIASTDTASTILANPLRASNSFFYCYVHIATLMQQSPFSALSSWLKPLQQVEANAQKVGKQVQGHLEILMTNTKQNALTTILNQAQNFN